MTIDERIASELRRHAPHVDEHMAWERIQSAAPVQRRARAIRLVTTSAAALGLLVAGFILVPTRSSGPVPLRAVNPFLGTWVTTDHDGSTQTMIIRVSEDDTLEIAVTDDLASVCSGAPSTMTGTGRLDGTTTIIVPLPVLTCDEGSTPEALSGPPLEEQLRDLTFLYDPQSDTLTDSFGLAWKRVGAEEPSPETTRTGGMWPQSSLEEVREAQELADAGDPNYTWQIANLEDDLGDAEIFARFLREELGWEAFLWNPYVPEGEIEYQGDSPISFTGIAYIRCAPGGTNPLDPDDPLGGGCAPTSDELRYEMVEIDVAQLGHRGPTGIWVVTGWQMLPPFLPEAREFLDGQVTFAGWPLWSYSYAGWDFTPTMETLLLDGEYDERVVLVADPLPVGTGCEEGLAPADAEALAGGIRTNRDLVLSEPVAVSVGGIEGLRMDVVAASEAGDCEEGAWVMKAADPNDPDGGSRSVEMPVGHRMRLYLLDLPEGMSARILAIAISAPEDHFERVVEAAAPIVDSFQFHPK